MCNDPNEFDQDTHSFASATGTACVACEAGRAADATNSECDICPPGRYSSEGITCQFCPAGEEPNTVEFSVGATHCIQCLNGTHRHNLEHPELGLMSSCATCSPGQQPNVEADDCETCPAGRFSEEGSMCIRCNSGQEPDSFQTGCQSCVGTYSADGSSCEQCPVGSQAAVTFGAAACISCTSLGDNFYSEDGSACRVCPAGSEVNAERSACGLCGYGLHSIDGATCASCPPGSHPHDPSGGLQPPINGGADGCDSCVLIGDATASADGLECEACPFAKEPIANRTACVNCESVSDAHYRGPTSA